MKLVMTFLALAGCLAAADDAYLTLTARQAAAVANAQRLSGQVGSGLDLRVIATDRSINYKLRATWMTPEAIRAVARLQQIARGLSDEETRKLVAAAESRGDTVFMIELHGREGSGVIPSDWRAVLGPAGAGVDLKRSVWGKNSPSLRDLPALSGAARRDYAYDVFWMAFPMQTESGAALFGAADGDAELTVRIYEKVGRLHWKIPASLRSR
jgi:hypothetical protein